MSPEATAGCPTPGPEASGELGRRTSVQPLSVNWHVWPQCNYHCRFCSATFKGVPLPLRRDSALLVPPLLRDAGVEKITFAGGEPTLCPYLVDLLRASKELGMTTMVVTNGTGVTEGFVGRAGPYFDWVALSVDSATESVETALGRGTGAHVRLIRRAARMAKAVGIRLKVNTVVVASNWQEDMHDLILELQPDRWKVFQALPISGENDGFDADSWATAEQFQAYQVRHVDLAPIGEDNDDMTGSYVMLDPIGRFFQNFDGRYEYSDSILSVGVEAALSQVGWDREKFLRRGGIYDWGVTARGGMRR